MEALRQAVSQQGHFSDEAVTAFLNCWQPLTLARKAELEGLHRQLYFLVAGVLRVSLEADNACDLITDGQFYADMDMLAGGTTSQAVVDALEPATLLTADVAAVNQVLGKYPELERLKSNILTHVFYRTNQLTQVISMPAAERYTALQAQRPELFGRVPEKYIAQLLALSPESLSRIKKRAKNP